MDSDEDDLGTAGLDKVLASVGVDVSSFSSFFSKSGGQDDRGGNLLAGVDVDSGDEDKYEDDISDGELPQENIEDVRKREREQARRKLEEERLIRRGLELQKQVSGTAGKKTIKKEEDQGDIVQRVWPDFTKGKRLRMSEVFYETPGQRRSYEVGFQKAKRRKLVHEQREIIPAVWIHRVDEFRSN
jgi:hypothetical protein